MTKRRRFTEREVLATLINQGVEIRCFRTGTLITLDNLDQVEREHLHELALGGPDEPGNCRYSLKTAHAVVTNGNGATTANSSKHRIAKAKPTRADKFLVDKKNLDQPREKGSRWHRRTNNAKEIS